MPEPHEFSFRKGSMMAPLSGCRIYRETWEWLKGLGVAESRVGAAARTIRHVFGAVDSVRGDDQPHGIPLQASDHGKAHPSPFINIGSTT